MQLFDDDLQAYEAKLRTPIPPLVSLPCPDCPQVVTGKGENHARALLAIHQEGTCQGGREVSGHDASDPAPDPPADAFRLTH